jgi:hypothetical protein
LREPVIPGRPAGPGPESTTTNRDYGFRAPRPARPRNDAVAIVLALLTFSLPASAQPDPSAKIEVRARPITAFEPGDPQRTRFGALTFRGGLELTSPHPHFGGLSAIRLEADGARFLSVSDKGHWLRGRIVYDGKRPVSIADAEMAPVLGHDGKPLAARGWYDTEALARDGDTVWLGIERVNRIVRLDVGRDGLSARAQPVPIPPGIAKLPHNKGLECLEFVPAGLPLARTLIAISERGLDDAGNIKGFLLQGSQRSEFSVRRIGDFDVTDCAVTPKGDLLVLERSFSRLRGAGMRIRRVPLASLTPGATVDGPALIEADMGYQIDNMEGLSVHRDAGALVLTLISDDNFSMIQRTLLLQFTLDE